MDEVPISEFKAKCLALLEQVQKTKRPIRVTRFGKAVADVVPAEQQSQGGWLGCMEGTAEIVGDILSPVIDEADFEAASE